MRVIFFWGVSLTYPPQPPSRSYFKNNFWQGNVKKSEKLMKINENSWYWQRKSAYFLNCKRNLNEIFTKDVTYDNIKSQKRGVSPSLQKIHFWKNHSWHPQPSPQPLQGSCYCSVTITKTCFNKLGTCVVLSLCSVTFWVFAATKDSLSFSLFITSVTFITFITFWIVAKNTLTKCWMCIYRKGPRKHFH